MIVFEQVTKVYDPDVVALRDVSFRIDKGEFVFIVGASGSGKSTLIRLLLKELEPTDGRIMVGGRDLARLPRGKAPLPRRHIGCVFQDFKLLPNRNAAENGAYALQVAADPNGGGKGAFRAQVRGRGPPPDRKEGARGAPYGGSRPKDQLAPGGAAGRRSGRCLDRARVRQPPAAARLRRADRKPRP